MNKQNARIDCLCHKFTIYSVWVSLDDIRIVKINREIGFGRSAHDLTEADLVFARKLSLILSIYVAFNECIWNLNNPFYFIQVWTRAIIAYFNAFNIWALSWKMALKACTVSTSLLETALSAFIVSFVKKKVSS